ncbi:MAG: T9SS type A sorting domain-containing protein [Flavobacteriales bacterium]|nr:T9SS type A sorting domain-containing protein [Flavobacteriales bacterium]
MKKFYGIIASFLIGLPLVGQSPTLRLLNYSNQDITGTTLNKFIFPSQLSHFADIKVLNAGPDAEVMVKRENVNMPAGYINYFCWGTNCYPPHTDVSTYPEFLSSGQQNLTFIYYIQADTTGGNWSITYTFFEPGNPTNSVSVHINGYTYGVSLSDLPVLQVKAYPNPARDRFIITPAGDVQRFNVTITDLVGKVILTGQHTGGQAVVDVRGLRRGLYVYHVDVPGYKRLTGKFWVE